MTWNTGYSATPLLRKLGIKPAQRLALLSPPERFIEDGLGEVPDGVDLTATLAEPVDLAVVFVTSAAELERTLGALEVAIAPDGAFWVAYPKRMSGVETDVNEDRIRDLVLPRGLVDNKICSISDVWSGIRICLRRENRSTGRRT